MLGVFHFLRHGPRQAMPRPHGFEGILTTEANATVRPVHHRMPVILAAYMIGPWLAGAPVTPGPAPDDLLTCRPVSPRVNDPRQNDPECVDPFQEVEPPLPF